MEPLTRLARSRPIADLVRALREGRRAVASGAAGSSTTLLAAALAKSLERPVLLVLAHLDEADEAEAEIDAAGVPALRLPALEATPSAEALAARLSAMRALAETHEDRPCVVAAPVQALMQAAPSLPVMARLARTIEAGVELDQAVFLRWLAEGGYRRLDAVEEPGDFAVRGGIVDVFPPGENAVPVRIDFFGDEVDSVAEVDLDTMGSDRRLERVEIVAADPAVVIAGDEGVNPVQFLPAAAIALLAETAEITEQARGYFERATEAAGLFGPPAVFSAIERRAHAVCEANAFSAGAASADVRVDIPAAPLPAFERETAAAFRELAELASRQSVFVACQNDGEQARCIELLSEHVRDADVRTLPAYVHRGFVYEDSSGDGGLAFAVVPYHELLHRFEVRRSVRRVRAGRAMDTFVDLQVGDHVVHADHGIALFTGLELLPPRKLPGVEIETAGSARGRKKRDEPLEEYLTLEFAGRSKLHVPAAQIDLVQKYVGGFSGKPPLSHLGGSKWRNQKARVAESVRDLAGEMLRVRAAREHMPGIQYPADTAWQQEFEAEFPYQETEDQLAGLAEIKRDMQGPRPMDRLVCGDVGFGKTELAIRAAFKACEFGKQVAVLVPTTVLAEQHERTFRSRFADYPFRVESLSRFKTTKEVNATLAALRRGEVDVVIGTHRLLSKDVRFADLGLVVIDEEQRFGVEHKERLLQLRMTVDVLTLSATPIPRTLHMAMLGIRDITSLTTPPLDRRAIVTEVAPYNARRVKQAIERELAREGQVYFVHNRVHNIRSVADDVRSLVPDARVIVGHGQMEARELEDVMLRFVRGEADVLVATTIIESGIDNPRANTMLINDADRFGLAELHQLRGRVGRYKHRAYCYMLLPPDRSVKEVARKRLQAIEQYSMLGAGFKIAMRDLEIRGAGNLLGAEQSGHIAAVGYEMYCRLLEDAVKDLSRGPDERPVSRTTVEIGFAGVIPRPYIPSDTRRLEAYRRLATARTEEDLEAVRSDLTQAYGEPPAALGRLLSIASLRAAAATADVRTVTRRGEDVVLIAAQPREVAGLLEGIAGTVRTVDPELAQTRSREMDGERLGEVYWRPPAAYLEPESLARVLTPRLRGRVREQTGSPSA